MTMTRPRISILATAAATLLLLLQGSARADQFCCQAAGPSCFDTFHANICAAANGNAAGGTCDPTTGMCGDVPVCCSEAEGPCTEVTASQCADTGGTSVLGNLCDAKGACRDCKPEGVTCPATNAVIDLGAAKVGILEVYDPSACCAGTAKCTILGLLEVPCALTPVDPVFTCTCNAIPPYGYSDAASLGAPPSNKLAMLYGAGAFGLLLPVRRRRRRK